VTAFALVLDRAMLAPMSTSPPSSPPAVILVKVGGAYCLQRSPGERWTVLPETGRPSPKTPLVGAWHTVGSFPGEPEAWAEASRFDLRMARVLLGLLSGRSRQGLRTAHDPVTEDAHLVAAALAATGARSRTDLAARVGERTGRSGPVVAQAFARCNVPLEGGTRGCKHPLPPEVLAALAALARPSM